MFWKYQLPSPLKNPYKILNKWIQHMQIDFNIAVPW